jgi:alkaline phosphatase D
MRRRSFLSGLGAFALPAVAQASPFPLGVASGCPRPTSIVLWTRASMPGPVTWFVAEDEAMRRNLRNGTAFAEARWDNTVHVDVEGLSPGRPYWYRFTANGQESVVGRTRTAPDFATNPETLRFAFASCAQYEHGYYAAYRHLADEQLDAVLFLGDYIYEASWGRNLVRRHNGGRATMLDEYRERYAQYKSDPDLQRAHAAHPWIVTWDDHEVTGDYTNDIAELDPDPVRFLAQRAAAYQAFWESMPLSNTMRPNGPSLRLYDRYRFGDLAEISVLDDRQYRSHHACRATLGRGKPLENCGERLDTGRTMLGAEQEAWFAAGMRGASAHWNVLAQQTLMAEVDRGPGARHVYWADGWDGYPVARHRLLEAVAASPVRDTLVLGGDVHAFWAADLTADFAKAKAPVVATEFVGGSITSQGPSQERLSRYAAKNPHIRSALGEVNGYGVVALDAKKAAVSFRVLSDVRDPTASLSTIRKFAVERGRPGATPA